MCKSLAKPDGTYTMEQSCWMNPSVGSTVTVLIGVHVPMMSRRQWGPIQPQEALFVLVLPPRSTAGTKVVQVTRHGHDRQTHRRPDRNDGDGLLTLLRQSRALSVRNHVGTDHQPHDCFSRVHWRRCCQLLDEWPLSAHVDRSVSLPIDGCPTR